MRQRDSCAEDRPRLVESQCAITWMNGVIPACWTGCCPFLVSDSITYISRCVVSVLDPVFPFYMTLTREMDTQRQVAQSPENNGEPASTAKSLTFSKLFSLLSSRSREEKSSFAGPQLTHADSTEEEDAKYSLRAEHVPKGNETSLESYYAPIDSYEGRHRYDPKATWSKAEEAALIRKLDVRVCAWCCLMFFALQLDRGNINQALSDNMLKDLGLNTNDYNTGQTIFYVSFLAAELPSQLVSKRLGPDNWIPIQMISWSIVASCQSQLTGKATFFLTRSLLGVIEGGFIPDVILYLSYFYKSKELPIRLSFFWGAYGFTFIISVCNPLTMVTILNSCS